MAVVELDKLYDLLGELLNVGTFTIPSIKRKKTPQMTLPVLMLRQLRRKFNIGDIPMSLMVFERGLILVADEEQIKKHQEVWEDWWERKKEKKVRRR